MLNIYLSFPLICVLIHPTKGEKLSNWNELLKHLPREERREFRDMIVQRIEQHEEERKKVKPEENQNS